MDLDTVRSDLKVLRRYYDRAQIIDPETRQVIAASDDEGAEAGQQHACYELWASGKVCDQCICMRAIVEGDTFIKFAATADKIYLVMAMPVKIGERTVALELLKDVTHQQSLETMVQQMVGAEDPFNLRAAIGRLNELVVRDELTGIYNRKFINERLPAEIIRSSFEKRPFSVIMADIDLFKRVNDVYGHSVGDEVLRGIAQELLRHVRKEAGDWVARYGGEEFLICLVNCDQPEAVRVAERMRNEVASLQIVTSAGPVSVTASFGVHTFLSQGLNMRQLIDEVDKKLYAAKAAGRNRVIAQ